MHQEWIKNKLLSCSIKGLGYGKAMKIAQEMGLDPKVLIFGPMVKKKGESIVGVIYAGNKTQENEDYEYARWNSLGRFWKDLIKALSEGYKNIWVQFGTENFETLKDNLTSPIIIQGQYYNEWEHKWK